jgi:hypothetical protein
MHLWPRGRYTQAIFPCTIIHIMRAIVFFALLASSSCAFALRDIPEVWKKDFSELRVTGSYYSTHTNYTQRGTLVDLPTGNSVTNFSLLPEFRYNYTPSKLSIFGGTTISLTNAKSGSLTRQNSQITDAFAGATTTLVKGSTYILLGELEGGLAISKVDLNSSSAITSDGADYIYPSLLAKKLFHKFWLDGSAGLKFRDQGLSTLLTWSGKAGYKFGKLAAALGMSGFESIIKDQQSESYRTRVTDRSNAGSYLFYSYNPAVIQVDASLDWKLSQKLATAAFVSQAIDGEHYAAGLTAGLQLRYNFDFPSGSSAKPSKKTPENSFEVETNEIDPELFNDKDE